MSEQKTIDPDKAISINESLGHWGARAVITGLVIEVVLAAIFHHGKTFLENWAPVLADVLVAGGVWAEVHFAGNASSIQKELRRVSELKIAELNERAGQLEFEAGYAEERVAKAMERAAEADLKAAQAQLDLEKFKAPRSLNDEQLSVITAELNQFSGQVFRVIAYWLNIEALNIANRIADACLAAGWVIDQYKGGIILPGGVVGVFVEVDAGASTRTKQAGNKLMATLAENGIAVGMSSNNDPSAPERIVLKIGSKL